MQYEVTITARVVVEAESADEAESVVLDDVNAWFGGADTVEVEAKPVEEES